MSKEIETLTEDERRALRGSKFAPLPTLPHTNKPKPRFFFLPFFLFQFHTAIFDFEFRVCVPICLILVGLI
jgi:hypothetical protein